MTINLSGQREQIVLSLLQAGKFATADEVIDEALRLVGQRYQELGEADDSGRTGQQLENLRRLGEKLDAMPTAAVTDGLSNRDHDRILYGQ
jgi:Arc/MetJ-type ribon-helix-helix transcriptional regulator